MLDYKALKGDPTDNIPGVPGVGEKTAAKLIASTARSTRCTSAIDEVKPDKLREKLVEHREQVVHREPRPHATRPRPAGRRSTSRRPRLGDYDRETVIRLFREYEFRSLIERLPPMTGEAAGDAAEALRERGVRRLGPGGARRRRGASGRLGHGAPGRAAVGGRRAPASPRLRCRVAAARPRPPRPTATDRAGSRRGRARAGRPADRAGRRDRRPAPDRGPRRGRARRALEPWLAAQPALGVGARASTIRGRAAARRSRSRVAGADGRTVVGRGPEAIAAAAATSSLERLASRSSATRSSRCSWPGSRDDPDAPAAPGRLRHPDRGLHPQRLAAQPVDRRRRRRAARPDPAAGRRTSTTWPAPGSRRSPRSPSATPLERRARRRGPRPPLRRDRAAADRGPGPDGGDRRRARPRGARGARPRSSAPRSRGSKAEIYAAVGHEFTIGTPKQLGEVLFGELKLPYGQQDEDRLLDRRVRARGAAPRPPGDRPDPRVADVHEAALDVRRGAAVAASPPTAGSTRRSTRPWPPPAGCPRRTRTSRTSRSGPTLGRRIRRAFVAGAPDLTLVAADYSQIELRILAHVSGDAHLKDAFAREADIHRETAALVLHKDPADVTLGRAVDGQDGQLRDRLRDERLRAVDAGPGSAARRRRTFITNYFATYSGISYYMLHIKERRQDPGLRDDAARPQALTSRSSQSRIPALRGGRRADGHQHADPGDRGRHHEDRDDPASPSGWRPTGRRRGCCSRSTTSCCSRCRATRSTRLVRDRPRDDGGRAPARRPAHRRREGRRRLGVDAPLTRADAIAAEAAAAPDIALPIA